jgi:hypothetical protein
MGIRIDQGSRVVPSYCALQDKVSEIAEITEIAEILTISGI